MNRKDLKATLLLALFLFLLSAPQPDSQTIAEMTHNFIVTGQDHNLQAADRVDSEKPDPAASSDPGHKNNPRG